MKTIVRKPLLEMVLYYITKEMHMNGFEIECKNVTENLKENQPLIDIKASAAVTIMTMFNFTLMRRKIIIYANSHLKNCE